MDEAFERTDERTTFSVSLARCVKVRVDVLPQRGEWFGECFQDRLPVGLPDVRLEKRLQNMTQAMDAPGPNRPSVQYRRMLEPVTITWSSRVVIRSRSMDTSVGVLSV